MKKPKEYNHLKIEPTFQKEWEKKKLYEVKNSAKGKKFYGLVEFPFPSGAGLHTGHVRSYVAMDIISRKRRMQGYNVLYPMGWDAFGLPTENYAIKTGRPPQKVTKENTDTFRRQLKSLGLSFDWSREVNTTDPAYYKWTQWIFLQMYKKGLAHKAKTMINWCPKDKIGLANEEVVNGCCERCGTPVEKRVKEQWMLAITKYADRLDKDLDTVDYLEKIKIQQRNWIGKSEGSLLTFKLETETSKHNHKILIGTRNEAKFRMIRDCFPANSGIEFVSLNDIAPIDDSKLVEGPDFKENARMKAEFYFKKTGIPTLSTDNIFWMEKWPKDNGVIVHMRKEANPKSDRATDAEVVAYFDEWIKKHGTSKAHFIFGLSYADKDGVRSVESTQRDYIAQSDVLKEYLPGYPMEAFLKDTKTGEFKFDQKDSVRYDKLIHTLATEVKNWIVKDTASEKNIQVFTTRADTLFGVTYVVLAPEHDLVAELLPNVSNKKEVEKYISSVKNKSDIERTSEDKEKTGVALEGIFATNPVNGEKVPVWVADYVLATYGTGAVMAVPAHDERDFVFAKKYKLPIKKVVAIEYGEKRPNEEFKDGGAGVVFDPETQKYAVGKWKEGRVTFFAGGVNKGEKVSDAIVREVTEESGLYDFERVEWLGVAYAHYHNKAKNVNRFARAEVMLFILNSRAMKETHLEAHEQFDVVWMTADEIRANWSARNQDHGFDHYIEFLNEGVAKAIELGYDNTSDPKKYAARATTEYGILENSGMFNGMESAEAKKKITEFVAGELVTKYKLRDWVFSRQRYWGEPIPMVDCPRCGWVPVPEKDLPITLPAVKKYQPTDNGESPLAAMTSWTKTKCPQCIEDNKKTKYLVFDFDGVIGDTYDALVKNYLKLGLIKNEKEAKERVSMIFNKQLNADHGKILSKDEYARVLASAKEFGKSKSEFKMRIFTDFVKEVNALKNVQIAVVSAGSEIYVKREVKKSKLKCDIVLCAEDHLSKHRKLEMLAKKWKVRVKDMYYFTDSNSDVYELRDEMDSKKIIGCAWGYLGFDELKKTLPENQILKTSKDLPKFFNISSEARRETDTMPNWAGSSWYFLRYTDPEDKKEFASKQALGYWMKNGVDWYNGGMEHTTLHLLYSRFWHKFLYDLKLVPTSEPYMKRTSHGMILAEGGAKMSKSVGNVVNPDDIIKTYGADTLRLYEMFMGPFDQAVAWSTASIIGPRRFIERVWRLQEKVAGNKKTERAEYFSRSGRAALGEEIRGSEKYSASDASTLQALFHKTIKKVGDDIESTGFNTAISSLMILLNEMEKAPEISKKDFKLFIQLLAPFVPHIADELWHLQGEKGSVHVSKWPSYDPKKLVNETVTIAIQVNGKVRTELVISKDMSEEEIKAEALKDHAIVPWIENKEVKRIIYVPGRLVNIVV